MFNYKNVLLFALMTGLFSGLFFGTTSANENLRDPTQPLGHISSASVLTEKPLRLQSVLVSESRKMAFINGQQLREQDVIKNSGNTQVIRIDSGGVVLQKGSKRWRMDLNSVVRH